MSKDKIQNYLRIYFITFPILYIIWCFIPIYFKEETVSIIILLSTFNIYLICLINYSLYFAKRKYKNENQLAKFTIVNSIVIFSMLIVSFFIVFMDGMDGWTEKPIFISKQDPKTKIMIRSFGGGAWDSSFPEYKVQEVVEINKNIRYISDIDTNKINRDEWIRCN